MLLHSRVTRAPVGSHVLADGGRPFPMSNEHRFILIALAMAGISMTLALVLLQFIGDGGI